MHYVCFTPFWMIRKITGWDVGGGRLRRGPSVFVHDRLHDDDYDYDDEDDDGACRAPQIDSGEKVTCNQPVVRSIRSSRRDRKRERESKKEKEENFPNTTPKERERKRSRESYAPRVFFPRFDARRVARAGTGRPRVSRIVGDSIATFSKRNCSLMHALIGFRAGKGRGTGAARDGFIKRASARGEQD